MALEQVDNTKNAGESLHTGHGKYNALITELKAAAFILKSAATNFTAAVLHKDLSGSDLHTPKVHASRHTDGSDDVQNATAAQKGLATAAQITKLNGFPDELKNLITHEIQQLETLGDTITIAEAQWGALGTLVEWTAWVPTLTSAANLSGYDTARYFRIGDLCFFHFIANNKNVTTAGYVEITLPFTTANTDKFIPSAIVNDGSNWIGQPHIFITENSNLLSVYKNAAAGAWAGDETGVSIRVSGFFEIV